jgi:nucleoside-diphosphate-sugar epimerase
LTTTTFEKEISVLAGQKILLTGVTGRVGGALANALVRDNEVWGLARYSQPGSVEFWQQRGINTLAKDFADGDFSGVPTDFDYVVHPGAWAGVGGTDPNPNEAIRINAEGTGLLMAHCRAAKAFLHVSTCGVYASDPDPMHVYRETDPVSGGPAMLDYTASKLAAEGAVRTMARVLGLPTIICRLNMQYRPWADCGSPNRRILDKVLTGLPIDIPADYPAYFSPVHNDDLYRFIEPCLAAAAVPAPIVNWGGDEPVSFEDMALHMGRLVGIEPIFVRRSPYVMPPVITDNTFRKQIAGPCAVHWKEGFKDVVRFAHPDVTIQPV